MRKCQIVTIVKFSSRIKMVDFQLDLDIIAYLELCKAHKNKVGFSISNNHKIRTN